MKGDLGKRIKSKFKTYEDCADAISVNIGRFRYLLSGKTKWERTEILKLCTELGMTKDEMLEYFEPTDVVFVKYYAVREKILEQFENVAEYCSAIGCSSTNIGKKLNGKYPWMMSDIATFCNIFDVPNTDVEFYFGTVPDIESLRYHIKKRYGTVKNCSNLIGCHVSLLINAFNRRGTISEQYMQIICDTCGINKETYFECIPVVKNAFEIRLNINDGERKEIAKKIGLSYNAFTHRILRYTRWTDKDIQTLQDILNIDNICDFIDAHGYTKMVIINRYMAKMGVW